MSTPTISVRQILPSTFTTVGAETITQTEIQIGDGAVQLQSLAGIVQNSQLVIGLGAEQELVYVQGVNQATNYITLIAAKLHPTGTLVQVIETIESLWEPQYGNGQANFITDAAAVAQIIKQRLQLLLGEWWEARDLGLPLWQEILGSFNGNNPNKIALILQQNILGAPYVTGMSSVQTKYIAATRQFQHYAVVQTTFGPVVVSNYPQPPSGVLSSNG